MKLIVYIAPAATHLEAGALTEKIADAVVEAGFGNQLDDDDGNLRSVIVEFPWSMPNDWESALAREFEGATALTMPGKP